MVAVSTKSKLQSMKSSTRLFIEPPLAEGELLSLASEAECRYVADFRQERRRREALMWRYIVRRELGEDVEIAYNENGAPVLLNRKESIGVSHSADFVAVVISDKRCAVDIERLDRNFDRVAERYIRPEEQSLSQDCRLAAAVWCAKETLYKYSDEVGLDFLRDVKVLSVDFDRGLIVGQIKDNLPVDMRMMFHSDNVVVYIA